MKKEEKQVSIEGEIISKIIGVKTKIMKEPQKIKRGKQLVWLPTKGYETKQIQIEGLYAQFMCLKQDKEKKQKPKKIIMQLHGGAYLFSLKEDRLQKYRFMSYLYSKASGGADVLTIDYRVAPENPFPAALEDSLKAYEWIVKQGYLPENIVIVGDSAGGGLSLASVLALRDKNKPLPKAVLTLSAWTNLTANTDSVKTKFDEDPVFGLNEKASQFMYSPAYANGQETNPYVSPYFGDFTGFPPMLMQVGEKEMLLNDTVDVANKARTQNVEVHLSVYPGMVHVFQMAGSILPEAEQAWEEIKEFFCTIGFKKEEEKTK